MLQDIRDNAQGTVAKVVVGLIILTFALFGVDSIIGGIGGEPEVAVVNDTEIKEIDFLRAVDIKKRQILNQMGQNADPSMIDDQLLKRSVLEGMIDQEILLQDAVERGIYVSEQSVDGLITGINQFQVDGKFDNALFLASIRNFGMTTMSFKESIKKEVLISQPRNAIVSSSFLLDDEFNRLVAIDRQTRSYSLMKFEKSKFLESVSVSEGDVAAYYEKNSADFKTVESVDVEYVVLSKDNLLDQVSIDEESLVRLYETEVESFESTEERNASHILIEVNDEVSEAEAKVKIEEIVVLLNQGQSFDDLAKEYSNDIGSASQGGSLGFSAKGTFLPEFEDSLFELAEGEVSKPVFTEYGYHLIKLVEIQTQPVPSYEEMKASLEADAKAEKAEARYVELSEKLADISYASSDLSEPSDELGLKIETHEKVSTKTQDDLFQNTKVKAALFSKDVLQDGNNSELIEISGDKAVVVRVVKHYPEEQKAIELVSEQIKLMLTTKRASEFAVDSGKKLIEKLSKGDADSLAGVEWEKFSDIKRNDSEKPQVLLRTIFSLPRPESDNVVLDGVEFAGDYVVIKLDSVNEDDVNDIKDEERKAIERVVGNGLGNSDYQMYQASLKAAASIKKI